MAKTCPQALQLDVLHPCEPLPTSAFISMLGDEGKDFEADIFERLAEAVPDAVVVDRDLPRSERETATVAAMDDGVPLVIGGRLPVDRMALRAGEPDLLVRSDALAQAAADDGYLPVDVKHHKTLDVATREDADRASHLGARHALRRTRRAGPRPRVPVALARSAPAGPLSTPAPGVWARLPARPLGRHRGPGGARRLVRPRPAPLASHRVHRGSARIALLSTLEVYDLEFAYRLSVIDASLVHLEDPTSPLLAEPIAVKRVRRVWVAGLVLRADGGVG